MVEYYNDIRGWVRATIQQYFPERGFYALLDGETGEVINVASHYVRPYYPNAE